ncbi:MAG: site-specific DNA-methyltransferase [Chloroflexi bacterium]|nr:site-specific DNA-methyltransferase [Chloroflexota bacterium]
MLRSVAPLTLQSAFASESGNTLIQGENLSTLASLLNTYCGQVHLVYIDPPFATNETFKMSGTRARTVSGSGDILAYDDTMTGDKYFEFLRERLIFLRELLADTGSIYLHIDYKVGHYVKVIMDEVFGANNFRNDVTRIKCNPKNFNRKSYGNIKDLILFYSKSDKMTWNDPRLAYSAKDAERLFKKSDANGRRYTTTPLHAPGETRNGDTGGKWRDLEPPEGRHWRVSPETLEKWDQDGIIEWSPTGNPRKKIYMDERRGKKAQDIWEYKDPAYPEYPTQKNIELLKFIISASSRDGDLVLDCFAGSGTTLVAAEQLGRRWLGIDQSEPAIEACQKRLTAIGADYNLLYDAALDMPVYMSDEPRQRGLWRQFADDST